LAGQRTHFGWLSWTVTYPPLVKIPCVTFWVSLSTPKREAKIWAWMALATVQYCTVEEFNVALR
jgi:hypothetical protein